MLSANQVLEYSCAINFGFVITDPSDNSIALRKFTKMSRLNKMFTTLSKATLEGLGLSMKQMLKGISVAV